MKRSRTFMHRVVPVVLVLTLVPVGGLPTATAAGNPRATGGGTIFELEAKSTVAFHAIDHGDSVKGKIMYHSRALDLRIQVDVDCLSIVGNTAVLSGIITDQRTDDPSIPNLVGRRGIFQAEDNGEGANEPPDLVSDLFITSRLERNCTNFIPPGGAYLQIDGNVQVQP